MIPVELMCDKDGLLYYEDEHLSSRRPLFIDKRNLGEDVYYQHMFYPFNSTEDYIIKYCCTIYTRKEVKQIRNMLETLISKQNNIPNVDFPIGYFKQFKKIAGQIIRYYPNGLSLDNILSNKDLNAFGKYYYHDEDSIHNLFLFLNDVLDIIYEMYENGIYYTDSNPGNFVLVDNKVKLIDFDHRYVKFNDKDMNLKYVLSGYNYLLNAIKRTYELGNQELCPFKNFEQGKQYVKKMENSIRK